MANTGNVSNLVTRVLSGLRKPGDGELRKAADAYNAVALGPDMIATSAGRQGVSGPMAQPPGADSRGAHAGTQVESDMGSEGDKGLTA